MICGLPMILTLTDFQATGGLEGSYLKAIETPFNVASRIGEQDDSVSEKNGFHSP
jgi:hypothetical protein